MVVSGASAKITNYSPWVTSGFTWAWTMLTKEGVNVWAQIGWREHPGGSRYTWVQWTDQYGSWYDWSPTPQPVGQSTYYKADYQSGNPYSFFNFYVNGTKIHWGYAYWSPNSAQMTGEITTSANQEAGAVNSRELFYDTQIYYSGAWRYFSPTAYFNSHPTWFGETPSGPSSYFYVWDKACST